MKRTETIQMPDRLARLQRVGFKRGDEAPVFSPELKALLTGSENPTTKTAMARTPSPVSSGDSRPFNLD